MAKTPLYYAIRSHRWKTGEVIAVTSEKPGHWYGHTERHKMGTHGSTGGWDSPVGKFPTPEAAYAARDQIEQIKTRHKPLIDAAKKAYAEAQDAERQEIDAYAKAMVA